MSFGGGQGGFSFGQQPQAGTNTLAFGSPAPNVTFPQPSSTPTIPFGNAKPSNTTNLFGSPANTNMFGSITSQPSTGFSFGQSTPTTSTGTSFSLVSPQTTTGFSFQGMPNTGFGSPSVPSNAALQPSTASTNLLSSASPAQPAFGFGSNTSQNTAATFGGVTNTAATFGGVTNTPASSTFGNPVSNTGFNFAGQANNSFGMTPTASAQGSSSATAQGVSSAAPASQPLSFGTPATTGGLFSFTNSNPNPLFGSTASPQIPPASKNTVTFGQTATISLPQAGTTSTNTTPNFSFGPTTSLAPSSFSPISSSGLNFGAVTTTNSGTPSFGMGLNPTTTGASSFMPTSTTSGVLSFGSTTTPGSVGFGTTTTATTSSGLSFGGSSATSTAGLSFGTTVTASSFTLTTPTSSQITSTSSSTLAPAYNFGTTTSNTASTPSTGALLSFTATTTSSGLNFGSPLVSTTASQPSLTFGTSQPGQGFAITSASSTTSTVNGGLWSNTATTKPFQGLGGVAVSASSDTTLGVTSGKSDGTHVVKETNVPAPLLQVIQDFKKYVKEQKCTRDHITRMSSKPIYKVEEETSALKNLLMLLSSGIQRTVGTVRKLKDDTNLDLRNVEIAQRTKDTPPGLQYENTAPQHYFHLLIQEFELRMHSYKTQIEEMEKYIGALTNSSSVTPNDLNAIISRLHETFVALAAQLQVVHEGIDKQKEHYLLFRKTFTGDTTNIFDNREDFVPKSSLTNGCFNAVTIGPTPFTSSANLTMMAMNNIIQQSRQPSGPPVLGLGTNQSTFPSTGTQSTSFPFQNTGLSFGNNNQSLNLGAGKSSFGLGSGFTQPEVSTFGSPQPLENRNFMLQKPPVGNKRGKRN